MTLRSRIGLFGGMLTLLLGVSGVSVQEVFAQEVIALDATSSHALLIVTTELAPATLGVSYDVGLLASGGTEPRRFELASGSLPEGIRLTREGRLVGDPGSMGEFTFSVRLIDGFPTSVTKEFHLSVGLRTDVSSTESASTTEEYVPFATTLPPQVYTVPFPPSVVPQNLAPFSQPPLLGTFGGNTPTLLPYNPGPLVQPVAPVMGTSPVEPPRVVGTFTTSTQSQLIQYLEGKGIDAQSLVRISSDPSGVNTITTYVIGRDARRHAFPHPTVLSSWFQDTAATVRTLSQDELKNIPLGANITYRPGVQILQFESPVLYVVTGPRMLRKLANTQTAAAIYGSNWEQKIVHLSDAFFADYQVSMESSITDASQYNAQAIESAADHPAESEM